MQTGAKKSKRLAVTYPTGISKEQYDVLRALVRAFVVKRPSELAEYRVCISPDGHERHSVLVWGDLFEYCNLELMALGLFHVNRPGRSLRHNTQPTKANLGATPPESLSARDTPPPLRAARSPSKACGSLRRTRSRRALGGL